MLGNVEGRGGFLTQENKKPSARVKCKPEQAETYFSFFGTAI